MSEKKSRFTPQNLHWQVDLAEREAPDTDRPAIFGDLNHVDETYLEISRASGAMRGMMTILSIPMFVFPVLIVSMLSSDIPGLIREVPWAAVLFPFMFFAMIAMGIYGLRIDLTTPRDEPIRFNRKRGKVYVTIFKHTWNPFAKWGAVAKEFDWNTIQAEVTKFAGFNGKTYMERYTFTLLSVKPGTNEVLDRFLLASNMPVDNNFPALWAYIKTYMNGGPIVKPETPIRNQAVSFMNSAREWLPTYEIFQSPGHNGAVIKHSAGEAAFLLFLNLLATLAWPALFVAAVGHYIAMRFAPAAIWPDAMDAESKSAPLADEIEQRKIAV